MPSTVGTQKRLERDEKIKEFQRKHQEEFDNLDKTILEKVENIEELSKSFLKNEISAKSVMLFFCQAAIEAQNMTNCLTEILFEEALKRAEQQDNYLAKEGKLVGPFHGVPFSIKDTFNIEGFDSSIGLEKNCNKPCKETSALVKHIYDLGGIPFVKTNVPQTLMSFECSNSVWGATLNPVDPKLSPGGSSGGEAALLALKGSIIGIGSDIGGSLRIPAHFSGVCSLKPSYHRLSHLGSTSCKPVNHEIHPLAGPMASNVSNLIHFCRHSFGHAAHDVVPLLFRDELFNRQSKVKFGVCWEDPFVPVSPACSRAVKETVSALKAAGFEVSEFKYPASFKRLMPLFYELMSADGWRFYFKQLEGEAREPVLRNLLRYAALPNWLKYIASRSLGLFMKDSSAVSLLRAIYSKSSYEVLKIRQEVATIVHEFQNFFSESGIDVILAPCHVLPATPNGSFGNIHFCAAYTFAWNLLNQPIGVIPACKFSTDLDVIEGEWPKPFEFKALFSENVLQRAAQHYYASCPDGLPIGIQLIGQSNQDELVVSAMAQIESFMGPKGKKS